MGEPEKKVIKYVEFNPTIEVMRQAYKYDVDSQKEEIKLSWIELLAYCAAKTGGKFTNKPSKDMDKVVKLLKSGVQMSTITEDMKYYSYYLEAYTAVLAEFVGTTQVKNEAGEVTEEIYGLKLFSPIAKGYGFSHCDDFGVSRSYGYQRQHLGHDMMGSIGTPIIAVEGGTVEAMGWNQYGGWRIGIRSNDKKRYYYYAHLRKDHPFPYTLQEGQTVEAGDVIGYLGMTGYSTTENVNNMTVPHLHFGMQLIFDECQKECVNEIWIDVYAIIQFLQKNKSAVKKDESTKDYYRVMS